MLEILKVSTFRLQTYRDDRFWWLAHEIRISDCKQTRSNKQYTWFVFLEFLKILDLKICPKKYFDFW